MEYKRGPENKGADSLSRVVEFQFLSISQPRADWWPLHKKEVQHNSYYVDFLQKTPNSSRSNMMECGSKKTKSI